MLGVTLFPIFVFKFILKLKLLFLTVG